MICTLMFDIGDKEQVDIAKTRIIDLVNKTLSEANLDAQPQIDWSAPTPVTSITDSERTYDTLLKPVVWSEFRTDFEDEGFIHVDAWTSENDDEQGKVIAKINAITGDVIYVDERAKADAEAQDVIMRKVWEIASKKEESM